MSKRFTFKSPYGIYENCQFSVGYYQNGNLGIEIWDDNIGPITKVTVNPDIPLPTDRIAVKNYSDNEGMVDWLISMDIIEPDPVRVIRSGYVMIPVHMLTLHGKLLLSLQ